jgi:hypothetical protein
MFETSQDGQSILLLAFLSLMLCLLVYAVQEHVLELQQLS